jgi:hypothetical protein
LYNWTIQLAVDAVDGAAGRAPGRFEWQNGRVAKTSKPRPLRDVAAVFGKDQRGLHILRRRANDGGIEAGIVQPLVEGKPVSGEVITLRRRKDIPFLFDVKTEWAEPAEPSASEPEPDSSEPSGSGPAQVATDSYRRGWDAVWGRRPRAN